MHLCHNVTESLSYVRPGAAWCLPPSCFGVVRLVLPSRPSALLVKAIFSEAQHLGILEFLDGSGSASKRYLHAFTVVVHSQVPNQPL